MNCEGVYCIKRIHTEGIIREIIQLAEMLISKATLKNFKEVKFRFLLEPLCT